MRISILRHARPKPASPDVPCALVVADRDLRWRSPGGLCVWVRLRPCRLLRTVGLDWEALPFLPRPRDGAWVSPCAPWVHGLRATLTRSSAWT